MIGKGHRGPLVTAVERSSRFTVIGVVSRKTSAAVTKSLVARLGIHSDKVLTFTLDNGRESAGHEAHAVLLDGVRGHGKAPGEYRRVPNWIGPPGCNIDNARYVPISANDLPEAMKRWERHIHEDAPDRLVQLAVLHAEFEALHPFLDGNGRLGRMLVPLFMAKHGLLSEPMFYISAFFERNRDEYYERLLAVSRDGDWTQWIGFFLRAVTDQARENQDKTKAIRDLYDETARRIADISHSQYAVHAAEFLFTRPIFRASDFYRAPTMTLASGRRILSLLQENNFFRVLRPASGRSPAILAYRELLNITEGRDMF